MIILAVDDERHALSMLERAILEASPDATLFAVQDTDAALVLASQKRIDVAFLDIHMPGMTGIELAYELKKRNPRINIIFATGFSEYMKEGIDMRASGYLLKPVTAEAVRTELENLRNPIEWQDDKLLRAVTFGNFEVYAKGAPVHFERKQSKEIFAYLIDKRGTSVSYAELGAMLWEDEEYDRTHQKNLQVYVASLVKALDAVGAREVLLRSRTGILVDVSKIDCDYFRFLEGDTGAINNFTGQYMSAYSWAEFTTGYLERKASK